MLAESLDVFLVLHFIPIIEGKEGLDIGVSASLNSRVDRP
jgi:DNA-binding cell septation regulator SpoVG